MRSIGPYELLEEVAQGAQGVVYRARDTATGRTVAIKLLETLVSSPQLEQRFRREAQALARLRHPHILQVHAIGEDQGKTYIVLEWVEGESLQERLERDGPLSTRDAPSLVRKLALAVHEAHEQGILHRDLKPGNVLLDATGEPRLADFGLARDLDGGLSGTQLSQSGRFLGTPGYWPPEQARGELEGLGPTADVYGLGALLYALLLGRPPCEGTSLVSAIMATRDPPVPPRELRPEIPPDLERICLCCLEKEPGDRYPSAAELATDLLRLEAGLEIRAPRRRRDRWLLAVCAAVLAVVVAGVAIVSAPAESHPASPASPSPSETSHARSTPEPNPSEDLRRRRRAPLDAAVASQDMARFLTLAQGSGPGLAEASILAACERLAQHDVSDPAEIRFVLTALERACTEPLVRPEVDALFLALTRPLPGPAQSLLGREESEPTRRLVEAILMAAKAPVRLGWLAGDVVAIYASHARGLDDFRLDADGGPAARRELLDALARLDCPAAPYHVAVTGQAASQLGKGDAAARFVKLRQAWLELDDASLLERETETLREHRGLGPRCQTWLTLLLWEWTSEPALLQLVLGSADPRALRRAARPRGRSRSPQVISQTRRAGALVTALLLEHQAQADERYTESLELTYGNSLDEQTQAEVIRRLVAAGIDRDQALALLARARD